MVNNIVLSAMAWASSLRVTFVERVEEERGQDLLEYAILGGVIAAALSAVYAIWGTSVNAMATNIGKCIDFASGTPCTGF